MEERSVQAKRRGARGITILEIMMAFSVMAIVIVAFASVFPAGYRLNFANLNQNKAISLANSVAEELRAQDIPTLNGFSKNSDGTMTITQIKALVTGGYIRTPIGIGAPNPNEFFFIDDKGVTVQLVAAESNASIIAAYITVTVKWTEPRHQGPSVSKKVTTTTMTTNALAKSFTGH